MGEIRSTLDLIMDKTRGMSLSQEEKESLHTEELRKRANGFKIRLLDDPSRADEILATLDNEPESDRQAAPLSPLERDGGNPARRTRRY